MITVAFELTEVEYREAVRVMARRQPDWYRPLRVSGWVGCSVGIALALIDFRLASAAVPLALFGLFVMSYPLFRTRDRGAKGWRNYFAAAGPVVWDVSAYRIVVRSERVETRYQWSAFDRFEESRSLFLIYRGDQPLLLPKRAFEGTEVVLAFRSLLAERWPARALGFPVKLQGDV